MTHEVSVVVVVVVIAADVFQVDVAAAVSVDANCVIAAVDVTTQLADVHLNVVDDTRVKLDRVGLVEDAVHVDELRRVLRHDGLRFSVNLESEL